MSDAIETHVHHAINANFADMAPDGLRQVLCRYVEALLEANRGVNLVSRKDTIQHVGRFLKECLFLARILLSEPPEAGPSRLLDVGSGGGFPGLVLKLAMPETKVTLVEGTLKKARFLAEACQLLDLKGIQVLWSRAEVLSQRHSPEFRRDLRHAFRWVTAKGLGTVQESLDLAAPFLLPGGVHWTFKGATYEEELTRCRRRMAQLQFRLYRVVPIPGERGSVLLGLQNQSPRSDVSRETRAIVGD